VNLDYPTRRLLRTDGTVIELDGPKDMAEIEALIGGDCEATDVVMLRDRLHVMILDDTGASRNLPVNPAATALYHEICVAGTTWPIRGDVVILPDTDFAREPLNNPALRF
jgi:hypothetical protein